MTSTLPTSPPVVPYGPSISRERASRVAQAAEALAAGNGWPMVIAVPDSSASLVPTASVRWRADCH